jgi:four helix bundle protein
MSNSILRDKSKKYARDIVCLCRKLKENRVEYDLVNQLMRSGTSVGANIHEARYAQGTKDLISKFEIALKECNESEYWLELLKDIGDISEETFIAMQNDIITLRRMLVSSVTTLKSKLEL